MNVDRFLADHELTENPFQAEEARLDPVFERVAGSTLAHPDFAKILSSIDQPSTSVVFGEKGSGKTAIRLLIGKAIAEHNASQPQRRVLAVAYDDLNPILDNVTRAHKQDTGRLDDLRLEDHQDAILCLAVTALCDALLGQNAETTESVPLPSNVRKVIRNMPRSDRVDLAVLAALYDQPRSGSHISRWRKLRSRLRLGRSAFPGRISALRLLAVTLSVVTAGLFAGWLIMAQRQIELAAWVVPAAGIGLAATIVLSIYWLWRHGRVWRLSHKIRREMPAVNRTATELRIMLGDLASGELARQTFPLPTGSHPAARDSRYDLTRRLIDLLAPFGIVGLIVMIDRVDEPTLVSGNTDRMKQVVWPMFDNKFLQQERVGLKLLLPIELGYLLHRETAQFFQEARLDKQHLIDRLTWSGSTLYDLCTCRLRACRKVSEGDGQDSIALTDLFEPNVSRQMLIDALDQMHQPRDAFKFLYAVVQEHCRLAPDDEPNFKIARLTLESVRQNQSQRVQELNRGLSPA